MLLASSLAQSFQGNLKIKNITFPEGSQLAYVYDIAQDSTGLIWMRPDWNFYTYDGHEISRVEREARGFPLAATHRFHADKEHPFFYIVRDSLMVYDPAVRKVVQTYAPENIASFPKPAYLSNVVISEDNALWALGVKGETLENSVVVRAGHGGAFRVVDSINVSWYYDVTLAIGNRFFVKLRDRIEAFDSTGRVKIYSFPSGTDPVMPSMVKDAENTIWVVYSPDKSKDQYGVYYLKAGQEEFKRLPESHRFPQEEKHGQLFADGDFIWHRGYPFRLSRMRIVDGTIEDFTDKIVEQRPFFPFYNSTLLNLYRDRSGELWLTTRAGIVKMTIEEDLFREYKLAKSTLDCADESCLIKGIAQDEAGNIYLSHSQGILVLNPETGEMSALPLNLPPQPQKEHALTCARETLFWNEYAIDLETFNTRKIIPVSTYDYLTHGVDPDGTHLWIAVNDFPFTLYDYDLLKKELTPIHLPDTVLYRRNAEIRQIHYSPSTGNWFLAIWMNGLLELDVNGKILNQYDGNKSPERWISNAMYSLYEDEEAQLWFGHGREAGLSKMDLKSREITEFPYQVDAFTGTLKRVFRILPGQDDYLWLVTEKGTMRLNKETGALTRFPMFPTLSEMAFHRLPGFAARDGNLYIGTPDGNLHAFDPETLYEKAGFDQVYPLVLNRYERFNENRDSLFAQLTDLINLSEIHLNHRDRYFSLEFFVPDYRNAGQNLYSYWLEEYDKDWSPPSRNNQLRYENLPPGAYTLRIRGGVTPDYYESSERTVKIFVSPAWYATWWAYSLFAITILGLFYLFYRYQVGQQLERAETRRIKELDTLKTRLYTNITHEFRTPLTVIMGMIENITGHENERKLIHRNSNNLLRLINQLLDLSKIDSGVMKMELVRGDIINYLQYLTESFYSMAHERKVRLTFYSEIPKLVMDFDEEKVQHILYNLLSNALKFTGEGGKVVLHANQTESDGLPFLKLRIQDTGIGIPEDQLAHIFDRFYQADNSSTRKWEGTGIGLALTKELVGLMGGAVSVESTAGKGTTFTLLLPVRLEAGTPLSPTEFQSSRTLAPELAPDWPVTGTPLHTGDAPVGLPGEKPLLLLIEDNTDVVTYIVGLLEKEYEAHTAPNGQIGIDMAFEMIPDIIISDVMMPGKDGYEVCGTLKNDERTSHIPIILLTAKAEASDRITGLRKGADAYLMKPFNKEELYVRLEKLLELRRALQLRYAKMSDGVTSSHPVTSGAEPSLDDLFLQKLRKTVLENLDDPNLGVGQLSRAVLLSPSQLYRKLNALTGEPPNVFIRKMRLYRALELLTTTDLTISEIAYNVGFNDPNYFSRAFSKEFGKTPSEYRK